MEKNGRIVALERYRAARDFMLSILNDYARAKAGFDWPETHGINWARDHSEGLARGNAIEALRMVDEPGPNVGRSIKGLPMAWRFLVHRAARIVRAHSGCS